MFGIDDAVAAGLKVLDKFVPDPDAKIKAEADLRTALLQLDIVQAGVNANEAANPNVFVAGARPAILWICALGFAWQYVLYPFLFFVGTTIGLHGLPQSSGIDNGLMELTLGMLGFGGLRTYERLKGVERNKL